MGTSTIIIELKKYIFFFIFFKLSLKNTYIIVKNGNIINKHFFNCEFLLPIGRVKYLNIKLHQLVNETKI